MVLSTAKVKVQGGPEKGGRGNRCCKCGGPRSPRRCSGPCFSQPEDSSWNKGRVSIVKDRHRGVGSCASAQSLENCNILLTSFQGFLFDSCLWDRAGGPKEYKGGDAYMEHWWELLGGASMTYGWWPLPSLSPLSSPLIFASALFYEDRIW